MSENTPDSPKTPLPHDEVMRRLRAGLAKYKAEHPKVPSEKKNEPPKTPLPKDEVVRRLRAGLAKYRAEHPSKNPGKKKNYKKKDPSEPPLPHDEVMRRLRAGLAKYKAEHPSKPSEKKAKKVSFHLKDELTPEQMKALRRIHFQHIHEDFLQGNTKSGKPRKTPQEVVAIMRKALDNHWKEYHKTHPKKPKSPRRTPEELAEFRKAQGKRLAEMSAERRAALPPKPPKPKRTPEELRAISLANLAKSWEAQRIKRMNAPPKPPKPKMTPEERKALSLANLAKAREAQRIKRLNTPPKPPKSRRKYTPEELHELRSKRVKELVAFHQKHDPKPLPMMRVKPGRFEPDADHSPYTFRWRHRTSLKFRVWPVGARTRSALAQIKDLPITGFEIAAGGRIEAWHKIWGKKGYRFELSDEDAELLGAAGGSGARIITDKMVLHAPGTIAQNFKQEYWLEVPVDMYPASPIKSIKLQAKNIFGPTVEDAVAAGGIECSKIVLLEKEQDIDEDAIVREVVLNNAVVVFSKEGISLAKRRELLERARYWVVPGRPPGEEGGAFRGYQIQDRFVRWIPRYPIEDRERVAKERLDKAHSSTKEKGRNARRIYLVETVVDEFAKRVGMSRQRVMSRFLDDGILEWLTRTSDSVKPVLFRETKNLMRRPKREAVNALEFYYRAIEAMSGETLNEQ